MYLPILLLLLSEVMESTVMMMMIARMTVNIDLYLANLKMKEMVLLRCLAMVSFINVHLLHPLYLL